MYEKVEEELVRENGNLKLKNEKGFLETEREDKIKMENRNVWKKETRRKKE